MDQHFAPKFYLAKFCDPNTPTGHESYLWVSKKNERRWAKRAPKNVAHKPDYYAVKAVPGVKPDALENLLARIESDTAALYRAKLNRLEIPMTMEDRERLALFIGFFVGRSPFTRDHTTKSLQKIFQMSTDVLASAPGALERLIQEKDSCSPEQACDKAKEMRAFLRDQSLYTIEPNRDLVTALGMQRALQVAKFVLAMKWKFLVAPFGEFFVTADSPASWEDATPRPWFYRGHGLAMKHVEFVLPLSAKLCLLAGWSFLPGLVVAKREEVRRICNRVIAWAQDEIYSPHPFEWAHLGERQQEVISGFSGEERRPGFHRPTVQEAKILGIPEKNLQEMKSEVGLGPSTETGSPP